jgi:predicted permease
MFESIWQDTRFAVRSLRRTPVFTITAVLTLALGIGANTSIFTLMDAVLFKPLDVAAADELVALYEQPQRQAEPDVSGGTGRYLRFSYPHFKRFEEALGSLGSLAAMTRTSSFVVRVPGSQQPVPVRGQLVSGKYFATLGVPILDGRPLNDDDVRAGRPPVVVVTDGFRKRVLGELEGAVGRTIVVSGMAAVIVGVVPADFGGIWTDSPAEVWLPLSAQHDLHYANNVSSYGAVDGASPWMSQDRIAWLNVIGRVSHGHLTKARAALDVVNRAALQDVAAAIPDPEARPSILANTLVVEPFARGFSGLRTRYADALFALGGMVAIVLLAACANIANLLVARSNARARETAIRLAIGASRARLVQQYLIESLLLAFSGGAAGLIVGQWGSDLLASTFLNTTVDRLPAVFAPDARILVFTAAVSMGAALLFGLAPAVRASHTDPAASIATTRTSSGAPSAIRGMRPLVAAQLAFSFVIVLAAALLSRTLSNFARVDPGFATDHVITVAFNPSASGYTFEMLPALNLRLIRAARTVPGAVSATVSMCPLLSNCSSSGAYWLGNRGERAVSLFENYVGPEYFSTTGIRILRGREFTDRDVEGSTPVAIISESVARKYFGAKDPIGMHTGEMQTEAEIVGVAADIRPVSLREPPVPMIYWPIQQQGAIPYGLSVRISGETAAAISTVRETLQRAEPQLAIESVTPMALQVQRNVLRERVVAYLASALGGLTLLLACLGLYGVLSYAVGRRKQEFGVRLALGAQPSDLTRMLMGDALEIVFAGTIAGFAIAYWTNRLLQALLFDVNPSDPLAGLSVAAILVVASAAACYLPALRASRIDPAVTLRAD